MPAEFGKVSQLERSGEIVLLSGGQNGGWCRARIIVDQAAGGASMAMSMRRVTNMTFVTAAYI
jgi:hypothetical protein